MAGGSDQGGVRSGSVSGRRSTPSFMTIEDSRSVDSMVLRLPVFTMQAAAKGY